MSETILIAIFAFIIFAPCLAAWGSTDLSDGRIYVDKMPRSQRRGSRPAAMQIWTPERELSEDFEIRSFAKGLSQQRLVIQDDDSSIKLTIAQVREAAVELVKLGGMLAAYEFAVVTARIAASMQYVKNAVRVAAEEMMAAAHNAHAWTSWSDSLTEDNRTFAEPIMLRPAAAPAARLVQQAQAA
jgi:hypothetical protein